MATEIESTKIPEVQVIRVPEFTDVRGKFAETFSRRTFGELGIAGEFVQDNQSFSAKKGTVRGLHFQIPPFAQAKLIRVLQGSVLDVAVDIRRGSPTFGQHVSHRLSESNREQFYVPSGFAHGFCTLEDETTVLYKVTEYYSPSHERGIRWNDPALNIDWGVSPGSVLLSARDGDYPGIAELPLFFEYSASKSG